MTKQIKRFALGASGFATSLLVFGTALVAKAADYSASTTAAINSAGEGILSMFFTNLPVILTFVVAIVVTLWGIKWVRKSVV